MQIRNEHENHNSWRGEGEFVWEIVGEFPPAHRIYLWLV